MAQRSDSETADANRRTAAANLSDIAVLRGSPAWVWFEEHCLKALLTKARERLHDPATPHAELAVAKERYLLAREFATWLDEVEAIDRESTSHGDPMARILRERIASA